MGEHREQLVEIGTHADAAERVGTVLAWLRTAGWSRADPRCEDGVAHNLFLGEFAETDRPGARLLDRFPELGESSLLTVVSTGGSPGAWTVGEETDAPVCPRCGAVADHDGAWWAELTRWLDSGVESEVTCAECGFTAVVGDWRLEYSVAVGALGVVLSLEGHDRDHVGPDEEAVAAGLLDALCSGVGGRWVRVHLSI